MDVSRLVVLRASGRNSDRSRWSICADEVEAGEVKFFLGTHHPHWLRLTDVPLFVSRRWLTKYRTLPRAVGEWALDSGAFTELKDYGQWTISPRDYVVEVRRFRDEVGGLQWPTPQDWMCEPIVISGGSVGSQKFVGTGLSVIEHQKRTVENFLELRNIAPELPWVPVLQGWEHDDYLRCADLYSQHGVDLCNCDLVGLGSVCRRQDTTMAEELVFEMHNQGIRLHAFGFKLKGLRRAGRHLESADSMAWSLDARYGKPLPECQHKRCANCLRFALRWREKALRATEQRFLFEGVNQ